MKLLLKLLLWCFLNHGFLCVGTDEVSEMEGHPVILHTGVETNQQETIKWYFNNTRIAEITGDLSERCTDVQCDNGTERFRDRLKLDNHTGSLTITNTRNTDSGDYKLLINSSSRDSEKTFIVTVRGVFSADTGGVFVMEGDSVTLHSGVETNPQNRIDGRWYFNANPIAQITGDLSKICTDVQCKGGDGRFRDRLKLDHQTGSLTITNINTTDSGKYRLKITTSTSDGEKTFSVSVHGASAAERDEAKRKSVKEGESVTLDPGVIKHSNYLMRWYFNDVRIAQMTGNRSQICIQDQCKEIFRDRLMLDRQTGSLTITNTTNTDSGDYYREVTHGRISIIKSFSVSVTGSGPSSDALGGLCVAGVVLLLVAAAVGGLFYYRHRSKPNEPWIKNNNNQELDEMPLNPTETSQEGVANGTFTSETDRPLMAADN